MNDRGSIIHNNPNLPTTHWSIDSEVDKENVVDSPNGILSNRKDNKILVNTATHVDLRNAI